MKLKSLFILSIISLLADDIWAANVDFDATIAQLGLKDNVTTDWSDSAEIKLPEPTLAYVNILSPEQVMPQSPQTCTTSKSRCTMAKATTSASVP